MINKSVKSKQARSSGCRMASEEEIWRNAAATALQDVPGALHYLDIKRIILEKGLIRAGLKTTLESVLFKDVRRIRSHVHTHTHMHARTDMWTAGIFDD